MADRESKRRSHRDARPDTDIPLHTPSTDRERAERIREVFEEIKELNNHGVPVVVEGKRDASAMRELGLTGEVITFHRGQSMDDFCDEIAEQYDRVLLLFDWDGSGEELMLKVGRDLNGHWEEFTWIRGRLKLLCQKDIKDIEGIPALLTRLEGADGPAGTEV